MKGFEASQAKADTFVQVNRRNIGNLNRHLLSNMRQQIRTSFKKLLMDAGVDPMSLVGDYFIKELAEKLTTVNDSSEATPWSIARKLADMVRTALKIAVDTTISDSTVYFVLGEVCNSYSNFVLSFFFFFFFAVGPTPQQRVQARQKEHAQCGARPSYRTRQPQGSRVGQTRNDDKRTRQCMQLSRWLLGARHRCQR